MVDAWQNFKFYKLRSGRFHSRASIFYETGTMFTFAEPSKLKSEHLSISQIRYIAVSLIGGATLITIQPPDFGSNMSFALAKKYPLYSQWSTLFSRYAMRKYVYRYTRRAQRPKGIHNWISFDMWKWRKLQKHERTEREVSNWIAYRFK